MSGMRDYVAYFDESGKHLTAPTAKSTTSVDATYSGRIPEYR
jgi:hypothetical protein